MRRSSSRRWHWALLVAAVAACRDQSSLPAPTLRAMSPARGWTGLAIPVVITGDGFYRRPNQSLAGNPSEVDSSYSAFLGDVELAAVARVDDTHLGAQVPAGLAPGTYDLAIVGPYGRATLAAAFTSTSAVPDELQASLEAPATVGVGEVFTLTLSVANVGGGTVTLVAPGARKLAGNGVIVLDSGPTPATADIAGGTSADFVFGAHAQTLGAVTVSMDVSGTDVDGTVLSASAGTDLVVSGTAALHGFAALAPVQPFVGEDFTASLTVTNTGAVAVQAVAATLSMTGAGGAQIVTPPAAQDVAAGEQAVFTWAMKARQAGSLVLHFEAQGTEPAGGAVSMSDVDLPFTVVAAPALEVSVQAASATADVGQGVALTVTAHNTGSTALTAVAPSLAASPQTDVITPQGPTPPTADLAPGASADFAFSWVAQAPGAVTFTPSATAKDPSGAAVDSGPGTPATVTLVARAALVATLTAPASAHAGEEFDVRLDVLNQGGVDALAVAPGLLALGGSAQAKIVAGPAPASVARIAASGGSAAFHWTVSASAAGQATFSVAAQGTDPVGAVASNSATASTAISSSPALITLEVVAPPLVAPGADYAVSLVVTNTGGAIAAGVAPSSIAVSGTGTSAQKSGPIPPTADVAPLSNATFAYTFTAGASGTSVQLSASASGQDTLGGSTIASGTATATVKFAESDKLFTDPFADGTGFAFLFEYLGKIWLGPSKDGAAAVQFDPDGTNLQAASFAFPRDTNAVGSTSANTSPAPYPSIGYTGCAHDTPACGPDDEDGRGLFGAGTLFGQEWLFASGARSGAARLRYAYLTSDVSMALAFDYFDLTPALEGNTMSVSAIHSFHDRLYVGLPDTSNDRPYLIALTSAPSKPGLDGVLGTNLLHLDGGEIAGIGHNAGNTAAVALIDTMVDFGDRLYLFNNGGFARSTVAVPGPAGPNPGDWTGCSPTGNNWNPKTAVTTAKTFDLEPADKATPQAASYKGLLYAMRNTTDGPQLWWCDPAKSGAATTCESADWSLAAPNSSGDKRLTQFNDAQNASATLLVATAASLYVGFNNATSGVVVFRSRAAAPQAMADFTGKGGCTAGTAGCEGFGGNGLGDPATARRVFSALGANCRGRSYVYLAAGNGTGPLDVYRLDE